MMLLFIYNGWSCALIRRTVNKCALRCDEEEEKREMSVLFMQNKTISRVQISSIQEQRYRHPFCVVQ